MHQHIGAHHSHIFLSEDSLAFFPVGKHHLNILSVLLVAVGGGSGAAAVDHGAALIRHPHGGEEGPLTETAFPGCKAQTGFFVHLPDSGLNGVLPRINQPGGELVAVAADGITVLPDQHQPILIFSVKAIENDPVGTVAVADGLEILRLSAPGGYIVGGGFSIPEGSL